MMETRNFGFALAVGVLSAAAQASGTGDVHGYVDQPRLFNDFPNSMLTYTSNFSRTNGSVHFEEHDYGTGGFANRHASWFGDGGTNKVDFNYDDGFDISMTLNVKDATNVGNIEAGFQADLFGFGLFGVLTANGEIAAFGSILPFHTFGTGLYNVGDQLQLRMIHRPGNGEGGSVPSTMEYMYNNISRGSGWVSSGEIDFTTTEGGVPSSFDFFLGAGAQIDNPGATGTVEVDFSHISIPSPTALGVMTLGGFIATRRRRA